jgi:iron complex transport system permease protein
MSRRPLALAWLGLLTAALALASLMVGRVATPLTALFDPGNPATLIVLELRAPRTVLGLLVGGSLGMAGAAMQGFTRNPLAEPGVLGVSSTAALGAVVMLYFGGTALSPWLLPAAAMAGAAIGVVVLLALAGSGATVTTFILAGVVIQAITGAGISLALSLAPNPWAVGDIMNWLNGALADRSVEEVMLAGPFILAGCALLATLGRAIDALTLGETGARSMGINLDRTRLMLAAGSALAVGAGVAVTGIIGFVGLVAPHLLRPLVGPRPSALLLPSALAGAALTLAADIAVRLIPSASEVRLGVAMAILGGPFFLWLLLSMRRRLA